jgi:hypothetical protein
MSIRDWVVVQLRKDARVVETVGEHGVKVLRPGRADAVGYCVEPDSVNSFTADALQDAVNELPDAGMVIVTRRLVDPDVYERARELKVCVDTFGGFTRALDDLNDIAEYVHREEEYIRRRLLATRAVTSMIRRGHRAWELHRINGLRPLMIVTHERYEMTDYEFTAILNQYPKLDLDAFVITNPSARGVGDRVVASAEQAGIPLYLLDDFLTEIRKPWT